MLKLRRGLVVDTDPLTVQIDGERRPAWADSAMVGEVADGDEVVVNTEAADLGLGSGGFDVVHLNLTRGLDGPGPAAGEHVMKLNYTSLQHSIEPVETPEAAARTSSEVASCPVLVLPLHGHLAPSAWAADRARPGIRLGYVQTPGGALPGALSRDVAQLRERGLLAGHVTAGAAYGGEHDGDSQYLALIDRAPGPEAVQAEELVGPRVVAHRETGRRLPGADGVPHDRTVRVTGPRGSLRRGGKHSDGGRDAEHRGHPAGDAASGGSCRSLAVSGK